MTGLLNHIRWQTYPLPASSTVGTQPLRIGQIRQAGPVALITAGVHGDEGPWGAWAIRKLLSTLSPDDLLGSIRIVPAANPLAISADLRNAPVDQLDLNRAFAGQANGSYTERLASLLVTHAIDGADVVIDLHGGGSWCVNSFVFKIEGGEHLSDAFAAPFSMTAPDRAVTLTGYARSQGAKVVAVEMGGKSGFEQQWADRIATGLRRALAISGVIKSDAIPPREMTTIPVTASDVIRPAAGGVFVPEISVDQIGTIVTKGTVLGRMYDATCTEVIETFTAPYDKTAVMLLRPFMTQLEGGAMTYVVAEPQ